MKISIVMRIFSTAALMIIFMGCNGRKSNDLENVRVVHVGQCHEVGQVDDYTVVEFPDGTRRLRLYHFGTVGEEFKARKLYDSTWE